MTDVLSAVNALLSAEWGTFRLGAPGWIAVVALPVVAALLLRLLGDKVRPEMQHARGSLLAAVQRRSPRSPLFADLLVWAAAALLVFAALRPQLLGEPDPDRSEGIDIVAVLDVSGSMRAADFKPKDRLTVAKKTIAEQLLTRERDRIGLVVFAGEAFTQAPLTRDTRLLEELLGGVRTGVITDGTAIGDAVATATNRLRESKAESKVIILVTDGDNNAGTIAPEKAAQLAQEFDIKIFPILVGRGGRVPFPQDTPDFLGEPRYVYVETPTNPALLKSMATATDGKFYSATDARKLAGSFQDILSAMDRSVLDGGPTVRRSLDLYPIVVLVALLLLMAGLAWRSTRAAVVP